MTTRRLGLLAAGALLLAGARFAPEPEASPSARAPLRPALVLARYAEGLAKIKRPKALAFQYTVEQLGLHDLEQSHRVYRSGVSERDETLVVDGYTLQYPSIRIFRNRVDRYDVTAVAPRPGTYRFAYSGLLPRPGGNAYVFKTIRTASGAFAVSEIEIDGRTFLPSVIRFKLAGNGARGGGELRYGRADVYWLVRQAIVSAKLTNGANAHERITWSNYQFPTALPPSTFAPPRATRAPLLAPTPVPTPAPGAPLSPA